MDVNYLFSAGIFVQLALLFYVLGLLARNELWLRGFLLVGTGFYLLYYYFVADQPLWDAIFSSSMIGAANLVMICVILREKSTFGMKAEMLALYRSFPTLNPGQFRKVMKAADWIVAEEDTQICTRNVRPQHLVLISKGEMILDRDGKDVIVEAGNFIGEISFLIDSPASANVMAPKGTHYVRWDRNKLNGLMDQSLRLSNAIGALLNKDVARKLAVSWPDNQAG